MSTPAVVIANFTNETLENFLRSDRTHLSHEKRVRRAAGTIALLVNIETGQYVASCVLQNWTGSDSVCRESSQLDDQVHHGNAAKYNKYQIRVMDLHLFKNPTSYATIRALIDPSGARGRTNMWSKCRISFAAPFFRPSKANQSDEAPPIVLVKAAGSVPFRDPKVPP
jgi:hypothetical protein